MQLSKSIEDYIEAIYILEQESKTVKSIQIATQLSVSKPAVHKAMDELQKKGLIEKTSYSGIELTAKGRKLAKEVYAKHMLIYNFLLQIGVSKETAEIDCCKIEHVISEETIACLKKQVHS